MALTHSKMLFSPLCLAFVAVLALLAASSTSNLQAEEKSEPLVSGIPLEEPIGPFNIKDVTGPAKGRTLCYACQYGGKPVIAVFFKEPTNEVAALLKEIDDTVQSFENKKLRAFGILLTDDPENDKQSLVELAQNQKLQKVPLTTYHSIDGPPVYNISSEANVNVMFWLKSRVKANHALRSAKELTEEKRQEIMQDTAKILP